MTPSAQDLRSALLDLSDDALLEAFARLRHARETALLSMLIGPADQRETFGAVADDLDDALGAIMPDEHESHVGGIPKTVLPFLPAVPVSASDPQICPIRPL